MGEPTAWGVRLVGFVAVGGGGPRLTMGPLKLVPPLNDGGLLSPGGPGEAGGAGGGFAGGRLLTDDCGGPNSAELLRGPLPGGGPPPPPLLTGRAGPP